MQDARRHRQGLHRQDANEQIAPWIDCWDDTTKAALAYIAGIEAALNGDTSSTLKEYSDAQSAFAASKKHGFYYVNHIEYAEVGVQHIVPFIKAMDSYLSNKVQQEADPNVVTKTYISDVFTTPTSGRSKTSSMARTARSRCSRTRTTCTRQLRRREVQQGQHAQEHPLRVQRRQEPLLPLQAADHHGWRELDRRAGCDVRAPEAPRSRSKSPV